ncbi:pre-mRNA 3'-end-processing factor FIP1-like [Ostrinia furnacalis]|uniref:pre-mRNA 3'-end-processing factor FIP1-like n=1 Tax=Ostrinia furnacalis TaxID=93504 RepID=UPI00103F26EE|nr:pre-mRNA 3'-end-processing factor FIP1-like [Ostrinia furnacalis]
MADTAVETAPGDENDDSWLYGDSNAEQAANNDAENSEKTQVQSNADVGEDKEQEENDANNDDSHFNDEHFADVGLTGDQEQANGDADSQDNGDSDSDDSDDVKVTIGEIKSGPQAYASLNIKRGVGLVAAGAEKPRQGTATGSKVTLEDLDGPGSINGVPALEFNIDTIEDKPWNKPGADISDYFNYGFNEVTWSAYCERQRRMRVGEAGVGLHVVPPRAPPPDMRRPPGPIRSDDGPPVMPNNYQVRENTIQVMTAERREYGRGHARDAPEYFPAPPPDHYYPPPAAYDEPSWGKLFLKFARIT